MAINTIQFATLLQQKLDEQVTAQSTSGWMEANAGQVKYNGGKEIKVPSISTSGLADYNRDSGYVQGSVTSSYETFTMTQDRGRKFSIDAMDVDESGFIVNATSVIGEFQRDNVIPEIDAYRYSKIYALAKANNRVATAYDPVKTTLLDALRADIAAIQDIVGDGTPLVITMAQTVASVLDAVSDISKHITVSDFKQGSVNFKVKALDEIPIRRVPSARMKTEYLFKDGTTSGQESGGFAPTENAKQINWIICPQRVPLAVSKTDKMRIFAPDVNQQADAWQVVYRKYHDLWITKNKMNTVMVNIAVT